MSKNKIERELTVTFTFAAVILTALLATWVSGCGNIPIGEEEAPTCVDLVTDECVPEVIEAFCATDKTPEELLELHVAQYERGFLDGITKGADACAETRGGWTCADFEDGRPNGHKPFECRR